MTVMMILGYRLLISYLTQPKIINKFNARFCIFDNEIKIKSHLNLERKKSQKYKKT
jgi:hypothetical protein